MPITDGIHIFNKFIFFVDHIEKTIYISFFKIRFIYNKLSLIILYFYSRECITVDKASFNTY